jgi:hypothetical protein
MTTIQVDGLVVKVHAELSDLADRNGRRHAVYVPDCCSGRYPSLKVLQISHMNGCPRDRQIRALLDSEETGNEQ